MYDQSLEQLIDAVIADGVITDQERKVVYKKAASLGIDQDEIEVYLEGKLAQISKQKHSGPEKQGVVKTCPNCGAPIISGAVKCSECGYLFQGTESNETTRKLFNLLKGKDFSKQYHIIRSFPIPNTREDLFEFLSYLEGPAFRQNDAESGSYEKDFCISCYTKYIECLNKAKIGFPNDPATKMFESHYRNFKNGSRIKKGIKILIYTVLIIIFLFFVLLFG